MNYHSLTEYANSKYILKGTEVVKAKSLEEWAEWFEKSDRIIRKTFIPNTKSSIPILVSTVFIGIAYHELFETMVFNCISCPEYEEFQYRDSNFDDAVNTHIEVVGHIRSALRLTNASTDPIISKD